MRTIVEPFPHDLAIINTLRTALGREVGYAAPPPGALEAVRAAPNDPTKVYLVLWPAPQGARDGSMSDPYADANLFWTLWVVGGRPDLVQDVQGDLEAALVDVSVPDRRVLSVELELGGVTADLDTTPTIYSASPTLRISTTPA